jgi:hypothetical protein
MNKLALFQAVAWSAVVHTRRYHSPCDVSASEAD